MRIRVIGLAILLALAACGGESGRAAGARTEDKDQPQAAAQTQIRKAIQVRNMDFAPCLKEPDAAAEELTPDPMHDHRSSPDGVTSGDPRFVAANVADIGPPVGRLACRARLAQ